MKIIFIRAMLVLCGLAQSPGAIAQAYKCTVAGTLVYQQVPCEGGSGQKLDIPPPPNPKTREGRIASAIARQVVVLGMTEKELLLSWGKPTKINRSASRHSISEQWVYDRGEIGETQYVYLEDGAVTSFQSPR